MSIEDWSHKEQETSLSDRLFALHLGSNLAQRRGYSGSINALGHAVPMKSLPRPAAFLPITSTSITPWKGVISRPIYALCKYIHIFLKPISHSSCLEIHWRCLLPPVLPSPPLTPPLALLPCSNAPSPSSKGLQCLLSPTPFPTSVLSSLGSRHALTEDRGFAVLLSLLPEATMGISSPLEMLYFVKCRCSNGNVILNVFFPMESWSQNFPPVSKSSLSQNHRIIERSGLEETLKTI